MGHPPRRDSRSSFESGYGFSCSCGWFVGFFGLTLGPTLASLYLSFTDFDLLRDRAGSAPANYVRISTADPKFAASMQVTFFYVHLLGAAEARLRARASRCCSTAASRGLPLYRAVFYLPSLLGATVAIAVLWRQLFAGDGLVNSVLAHVRHRRGRAGSPNPDYCALDAGRARRSGSSARR